MITIRSLRIQDFLSHKDTELVFKDGDKVLLDGVSGSGKSTIVDAIVWVLYGVGRVDNRSMVRAGAKEAKVTLALADGDAGFVIERSVTKTGKHTVSAFRKEEGGIVPVDAAGTREIQRWIEHDLLHASYELFINSAAYPQGNKESFVNATSARRKELLLEILKVDDIAAYAEKTREKLSEATVLLRQLETSIGINSEIISKNQAIIDTESALEADLKEANILWKEKESIFNAAYDAVALAEATIKANKAAETRKVAIKARQAVLSHGKTTQEKRILNEVSTNPEEVRAEIKEKEESISDSDTVVEELRKAFDWNSERMAIQSDRPNIRDYDSEIDELTARMDRMTKDQPECPAGNDCPYIKRMQPEVDYLLSERTKKEKAAAEQKLALAAWEAKINALGAEPDVKGLRARADEIRLTRERITALERHLEAMEAIIIIDTEFNELDTELASLVTEDVDIDEKQADLENASSELAKIEDTLSKLRGQKTYIDQVKKDTKGLKKTVKEAKDLLDIAGVKMEMLSDLKEAFGANGIQAVALDYLLPSLEDKINEVLGQLSDFRVRLDTQRDGTKDAKIEGLFITIRNAEGEEFSYDSYSGGEKLKITVAISEALASLQNIGFRILDELFVGLDEDSTDSFAEVLSQIQGRFSQMLCISHLRQIKDLFELQVHLQKVDGVSKVIV